MVGRMRGRLWIATAAVAVVLVAPSPAGAVVQIGQTFDPAAGCTASGATFIQSTSPSGLYTVPSNGVITFWSRFTDAAGDARKLKVGRLIGSTMIVIGESTVDPGTTAGGATNPTQIPVQAGDFVGVFASGPAMNRCGTPMPGYGFHATAGDVPVGGTVMPVAGSSQFSVAAFLEADCDSDTFGDETQDADTSSCNPAPGPEPLVDLNAPSTTITEAPNDRTRQRKATFRFAGTDTRAVAAFQCSLDGAAFAPCASPHTVTVKKGTHLFQVRAVDDSGNVGSPASDDWKRKKKRRRR